SCWWASPYHGWIHYLLLLTTLCQVGRSRSLCILSGHTCMSSTIRWSLITYRRSCPLTIAD
ncbi:hypothetical protein KSS87_007631, partial [Heliosperma pusillum]